MSIFKIYTSVIRYPESVYVRLCVTQGMLFIIHKGNAAGYTNYEEFGKSSSIRTFYHSTECNLPEESDWKYFIILTLAPIPRCSILYLVLGYTLI